MRESRPCFMRSPFFNQAFTLIELLIVVAIIAILAAIAVPNFLEAQVRAKVSRAQADMRSLATGIESYLVDCNKYPLARPVGGPNYNHPLSRRLCGLTTPVAYLTSIPPDVFIPRAGWNGYDVGGEENMVLADFDSYDYFDAISDEDEDEHATDSTRGCSWRLASTGPDNWASFGIVWGPNLTAGSREGLDYDATNGTVSNGDIVRTGPGVREWIP